MISYEASKWYVKLWRQRWYLYLMILHIKSYIDPELWMDYLLGVNKKNKNKLV